MVPDNRFDALTFKGLPLGGTWSRRELESSALSVSRGDTATPVAALNRRMLEANARAMQDWCSANAVSIAPHAKTTLSPELLDLQAGHGSWGMTAALPRQVAVLWAWGVNRVLLANEVSDSAALAWFARELAEHPQYELYLYADSVEGVRIMDEAVGASGSDARLNVLVELGHESGRTGARSVVEGETIAEAIAASPRLRLAGVAGYEGTIGSQRDSTVLEKVDSFLGRIGELARLLAGRFEVPEPIITAGGSLFFDRVVAVLGEPATNLGARLVIRSGCYLIHDHGLYARGTPEAVGVAGAPEFEAALSVWARVVSRPEAGHAYLDAGRRDLSHDAGLPVALERARGADRIDLSRGRAERGAAITALSDQHAFLEFPPELDIRIGDLVRLGISHPCTTLDRWRLLLLTDDDDTVVGLVTTDF